MSWRQRNGRQCRTVQFWVIALETALKIGGVSCGEENYAHAFNNHFPALTGLSLICHSRLCPAGDKTFYCSSRSKPQWIVCGFAHVSSVVSAMKQRDIHATF